MTDLEFNYRLTKTVLGFGVQNLTNTFPDRLLPVPAFNNIRTFPRNSPYGFNGRYIYGKITVMFSPRPRVSFSVRCLPGCNGCHRKRNPRSSTCDSQSRCSSRNPRSYFRSMLTLFITTGVTGRSLRSVWTRPISRRRRARRPRGRTRNVSGRDAASGRT